MIKNKNRKKIKKIKAFDYKSDVQRKLMYAQGICSSDRINLFLSDQMLPETGKWYKALTVGTIHSRKYKGIWDADPAIYNCEVIKAGEEAGTIEVHQNFLQALFDNFKNNSNETVPFVDFDHDQTVSAGPIVDVKLEDGSLWVMPQWNELGKKAVGDKQYMYLSLGIEPHINSQTGDKVFPVITSTSLVNIPVDKNQEILELKDIVSKDLKKIPTGKKAKSGSNQKIKSGDKPMDELLQQIAALTEAINSALESDETGAIKAAIGAAIDHLEVTCGLATEEKENGEGEQTTDEADKIKPPIPAAPATPAAAPAAPGKVQMGDNQKMALKINELELKLQERDFNEAYVGKKITPAQKDKYFALYLKDKANLEGILKDMPDLGYTKEFGSENDIQLRDVNNGGALALWSQKVYALKIEMEKTAKPNEIIKMADVQIKLMGLEPQLYNLAFPPKKVEA